MHILSISIILYKEHNFKFSVFEKVSKGKGQRQIKQNKLFLKKIFKKKKIYVLPISLIENKNLKLESLLCMESVEINIFHCIFPTLCLPET